MRRPAHNCSLCGCSLTRLRAPPDPHYGLPVVVCPACGTAVVRRHAVRPRGLMGDRARLGLGILLGLVRVVSCGLLLVVLVVITWALAHVELDSLRWRQTWAEALGDQRGGLERRLEDLAGLVGGLLAAVLAPLLWGTVSTYSATWSAPGGSHAPRPRWAWFAVPAIAAACLPATAITLHWSLEHILGAHLGPHDGGAGWSLSRELLGVYSAWPRALLVLSLQLPLMMGGAARAARSMNPAGRIARRLRARRAAERARAA